VPAPIAARLAAWLPAFAWAGLIFVLSSQPGLRISPDDALDLVLRKLAHAAVFGVLALLVRSALVRWPVPRPSAWALAITAAYAVCDELHQAFVATRNPSPTDVAIDVLGAGLALGGLELLRQAGLGRPRRAPSPPGPSTAP
jgi:VanZ family protein